MANSKFSFLKSNLLRLSGNGYNAQDAVKLQMAGNCINRALGIIQGELKGHPYTMDINNTVTAVIVTPYGTALNETNIIEVLNTRQRSDPNKMQWIPYEMYLMMMADPSLFAGVPSLFWTATQALDATGHNIWTLFFIPTPGSAITIYYDFIKNLQFTDDSTASDNEFSPLPRVYDGWIFDEAKPFLYEIIDPKNNALIMRASAEAEKSRARYKSIIMSPTDGYSQAGSARDIYPLSIKRVQTTPTP